MLATEWKFWWTSLFSDTCKVATTVNLCGWMENAYTRTRRALHAWQCTLNVGMSISYCCGSRLSTPGGHKLIPSAAMLLRRQCQSYAEVDNTELQDSDCCHACIVRSHVDMLAARGGTQCCRDMTLRQDTWSCATAQTCVVHGWKSGFSFVPTLILMVFGMI